MDKKAVFQEKSKKIKAAVQKAFEKALNLPQQNKSEENNTRLT